MAITIDIDENCASCQDGLSYFEELQYRHERHYGSLNLDTQKRLPGILLTPDYNSFGILTHFHIKREEAPNA